MSTYPEHDNPNFDSIINSKSEFSYDISSY